jgi:hypothetical protein
MLGLVSVGLFSLWQLIGCSPAENGPQESASNVVYLCRETKQIVQAPPQKVPAVHPGTGRATLFRALYCPECKIWRAVPPPDVFAGNPLTYRCPKHQKPMTVDGPLETK